MQARFGLFAIAIIISVFSCKKEKEDNPTPGFNDPKIIVYDDYTKLSPGNYWIYQDYRIDSVNAAAIPLGTYDSAYVEKDTVIHGSSYHKYLDAAYGSNPANPTYTISYLKDSLSYIVDNYGKIVFSSEDFSHVFHTYTFGPNASTPDTLTVTEQMGFRNESITVDAGTFITSTFRKIYHFPSSYPYSTREYVYKYAKNIGLILETTAFYNNSTVTFERRLVRYHVK